MAQKPLKPIRPWKTGFAWGILYFFFISLPFIYVCVPESFYDVIQHKFLCGLASIISYPSWLIIGGTQALIGLGPFDVGFITLWSVTIWAIWAFVVDVLLGVFLFTAGHFLVRRYRRKLRFLRRQ